jgi:hypothetical protein
VVTNFAKEGTCAHELAEFKLNEMLGIKSIDPRENLEFYDEEMNEATDCYAQYIAEEISEYRNPVVMVERKLDFSRYVPDGFGTGDCVIIADDVLTVCDFKYGKGVSVSAENNSQMMLYGLGALEMFDSLYDISKIKMVIIQPRIENISEFEMSADKLRDWAENILKPVAKLAANGEGEFFAGEHCRFCKIKSTCRKRAEHNLSIAKYDFRPPDTLQDSEIETILSIVDGYSNWVNDIKEYALSRALQGKKWNGYKVVEGRSNRKYINEAEVAKVVTKMGKNPYSKPKILGVTAMTKLLGGKKKYDEILGELTYKPPGKPTLVPISDKREAITTAENEFKGE